MLCLTVLFLVGGSAGLSYLENLEEHFVCAHRRVRAHTVPYDAEHLIFSHKSVHGSYNALPVAIHRHQ